MINETAEVYNTFYPRRPFYMIESSFCFKSTFPEVGFPIHFISATLTYPYIANDDPLFKKRKNSLIILTVIY
jgi:hypothetical protein